MRRSTVLSLPPQMVFLALGFKFAEVTAGNTKGGSNTVPLTSCLTTDNFCFYLQNRLIQTSQTGGQLYSDTSPLSIPWSL
jgi:hypothetical protein